MIIIKDTVTYSLRVHLHPNWMFWDNIYLLVLDLLCLHWSNSRLSSYSIETHHQKKTVKTSKWFGAIKQMLWQWDTRSNAQRVGRMWWKKQTTISNCGMLTTKETQGWYQEYEDMFRKHRPFTSWTFSLPVYFYYPLWRIITIIGTIILLRIKVDQLIMHES